MKLNRTNRLAQSILSLLIGLVISCSPAFAQNENPGIVPPNSKAYGASYGEWAARWWQWALGIPEAQNPVADTTGAFCDVNQSGPVWFLAGTFGNSVDRSCTVPAGKGIFLPVANWVFGAAVFDCEPSVPGVACDVPTLRQRAAEATTSAEIVEAWIDGRQVVNVRDYRGISPKPFSITFPPGAVFGLPAGTFAPHVADGYWLMLSPLSPGEHEITVHVVNTAFGLDFEVNYTLSVTN